MFDRASCPLAGVFNPLVNLGHRSSDSGLQGRHHHRRVEDDLKRHGAIGRRRRRVRAQDRRQVYLAIPPARITGAGRPMRALSGAEVSWLRAIEGTEPGEPVPVECLVAMAEAAGRV